MTRRLRHSAIENVRLLLLAVCAAVGPLAGWLLPQAVWRSSSGASSLGDYALVCCLALIAWVCFDQFSERGIWVALAAAAILLAAREVSWRFSQAVLSMIYSTAASTVAGVVLGSLAYEVRKGRPLPTILTPERTVVVLVGVQIVGWTAFSLLSFWMIG